MSCKIFGMRSPEAIMRISVITADSMAAVAAEWRTPASSPAPNRWAVITVNPDANPIVKANSPINNGAVAPTAAKACTPINRPTMIISAIL